MSVTGHSAELNAVVVSRLLLLSFLQAQDQGQPVAACSTLFLTFL